MRVQWFSTEQTGKRCCFFEAQLTDLHIGLTYDEKTADLEPYLEIGYSGMDLAVVRTTLSAAAEQTVISPTVYLWATTSTRPETLVTISIENLDESMLRRSLEEAHYFVESEIVRKGLVENCTRVEIASRGSLKRSDIQSFISAFNRERYVFLHITDSVGRTRTKTLLRILLVYDILFRKPDFL